MSKRISRNSERDYNGKLLVSCGSDHPKGAHVGPYWFAQDDSAAIVLIAHRCALADAEKYGDFLTCPHGHYDLWESWRTGRVPGGVQAIIRDAEYEEWPRGRVVFNFLKDRFTIYGDRQVFEHGLQQRVIEYFGIPAGQAEFATDGHYQSTRSLHPR